jgi:hypothetical protein
VQSENRIEEDMQDVQDRGRKKKKKIGRAHGHESSFPRSSSCISSPILFFVDYEMVLTMEQFLKILSCPSCHPAFYSLNATSDGY